MHNTKEELEAYRTVARLMVRRLRKIEEQIVDNPLAAANTLVTGDDKLTQDELNAYATVAICEMREVNALLDMVIEDMKSTETKQ